MRSTTTFFLLVIAIGLGIWIYLGDSSQHLRQALQNSKVLSHFQTENIQEIRITAGGKESVLSKHGDLWFFDHPITDRADQSTVAAVLDLLAHLTIRDKISAQENQQQLELSDEKLGFDADDLLQVELISTAEKPNAKNSRKKTITLQFGKVAPMVNTIYARIQQDGKNQAALYVVDGNPRQYLEDPAAAMRDQNLLYAPAHSLETLILRSAKQTIKLKRTISHADKPTASSHQWQMTSPLPARANAQLIERLVAQLSSLRVDSLLDKQHGSNAAQPKPVPAGSLVFELKLARQNQAISLLLSPSKTSPATTNTASQEEKDPPLIEARVSDRPATFLVRSSLLQQLSGQITANTFRAPHLAHIPLQRLQSIFIQTLDNPNVVLSAIPNHDGRMQWKSDRNSKRENANLSKIHRLISAVNEEKIIDFIDGNQAKPADYGLERPFTAITFNLFPDPKSPNQANDTSTPKNSPTKSATETDTDTKKTQLLQKTLKLGHHKDQPNQLFASFVGEPYIYKISPTFLNRVSPHPLKWKAPKVLSFSLLSLLQIERSYKEQPLLQLDYDYTRDQWTGKQADTELSEAQINRRIAHQLASVLGSLTAQDWLTTSQLAYQALKQPTLTLKLTIEEIDRALQEPKQVTHTLKFAATTTGFYYGSLDQSPDVFIIDRNTFRDLVQPIVSKSNPQNQQ
ncbi:MAG: DUF4340 domain-containing protein [Verrucomicrobiales bacterium]|nr:DUF4340 domain-containing protein [Verrucomicrobiales bacterium]